MNARDEFCPYRGLRPYTEEDRDYFFGREEDQETIAANVATARLTILYGASGVGKSSVLMAGVVPMLHETPDLVPLVFRDWQAAEFLDRLKVEIARVTATKRADMPLDELLQAAAKESRGSLALILDQFEDYFLYHGEGAGEHSFDVEFARAVNRVDVRANVLISIREDALSRLDRFQGRIPNLLGNYLRLEHLDGEAADRAIRKPLDRYNERRPNEAPITVEDQLVTQVTEEVKTGQVTMGRVGQGKLRVAEPGDTVRVEAPYLQMVLTRLWEEEIGNGSRALRAETLRRLGGARTIVRTHLRSVMQRLGEREQEVCARFFDRLVTPSGGKIAYRADDLTRYAGDMASEVPGVLKTLHEARILSSVAGAPGEQGSERYQIFHDVLAPAILEWQAEYREDEEREAARKKAAELEQQRAKERQLERQRRFIALLAVVFLMAVGLGAFAESKRRQAKRQEAEATASGRREGELRRVADEKTIQARKSSEAAERERLTAEERSKEAERLRRLAESRELASVAINSVEADADRSLRLAIQAAALRSGSGPEEGADAEAALHRAMQNARTRLVLTGHKGAVNDVTYSPDGRWIATGGFDNTVRIWDAVSGKETARLQGPGGPVNHVAFSPDGRRLASAGDDRVVRLWDLATRREIAQHSRHTEDILALAFRRDGSVVSASKDKTILIWDRVSAGAPQKIELEATPSVVAFDRESTMAAARTDDGRVLMLPMEAVKLSRRVLVGDPAWMGPIAVDRDGMAFATTEPGSVYGWRVSNGELIATLKVEGSVNGLAFSPGGRLAVGGTNVKLWSMSSGEQAVLTGATSVISLGFSPDGSRLAGGSSDGGVRVWDVLPPSDLPVTGGGGARDVRGISFLGDSGHVLAVGKDGALARREIGSGREVRLFAPPGRKIVSVAASANGRLVAMGAVDGTTRVWDIDQGKERVSFRGHSDSVLDVSFSRDGKLVATGGEDRTAQVWDVKAERRVSLFLDHQGPVRAVAFSPDGRRLVTASDDRSAILWDVRRGVGLLKFDGHKSGVNAASYSPDGRRVATGASDGAIIVWNGETGDALFTSAGHAGRVLAVAFTPDGQRLVSGGADGTVRVWDARTGRPLFQWSGLSGGVTSVAVSGRGERLLAYTQDGGMSVFALRLDELLGLARKRAGRGLTAQECREYLHAAACPPL